MELPSKSHEIIALYEKIEKTATETLQTGNAVENPLLQNNRDQRYVLSVDLLLPTDKSCPITNHLVEIINQVKANQTGFITTSPDYLHITL